MNQGHNIRSLDLTREANEQFLSLTGSAGFGLGSTPLPKLSLRGPPPLTSHSCHSNGIHAVLNGVKTLALIDLLHT